MQVIQINRSMPRQQGFSLMELLIVLTIIGVLATILVSNMQNVPDEARRTAARATIKDIENALLIYQMHNGNVPSGEQGLKALVSKPGGEPTPRNWQAGKYLQGTEVPKDPWGYEYKYVNPGSHNANGYDIFSVGKDGKQGGDDDIGNWTN